MQNFSKVPLKMKKGTPPPPCILTDCPLYKIILMLTIISSVFISHNSFATSSQTLVIFKVSPHWMYFGPEGDIIYLDKMVTILFISEKISLFIQ